MERNQNKGTHSKRPLILAGIGGGVAAYKAVEVVSALRQRGVDVHVAMSEAACRFVTPLTFSAVSGHRVLTTIFPQPLSDDPEGNYPHLYPATRADVFVLMPATANTIGHVAQGLGHDIVPACALSLPPACRKVFCPSMNTEMWMQDAVRNNVRILENRGWRRLGPETGALACGMEGPGRMTEPEEIIETVLNLTQPRYPLPRKRVLILSGPTHEYMDAVRYIGNPSSGLMGKELALEAVRRGADVTLISGPVHEANLPRHEHIRIERVTHGEEMIKTAAKQMDKADIVVYAAAVADYKPAHILKDKPPKQEGEWDLRLVPNPDIAATLNKTKRANQITIGFSLQSSGGHETAQSKLKQKHLDAIVLNHVDVMAAHSGAFTYMARDAAPEAIVEWGTISKGECAERILDEAAKILEAQ